MASQNIKRSFIMSTADSQAIKGHNFFIRKISLACSLMVAFFDIISLSLVTAKFATYRAHYEATSSTVGFLITN